MSFCIKKVGEYYKVYSKSLSGKGEPKTEKQEPPEGLKEPKGSKGSPGVLGLSDYAKSPNFKNENFQKF